MTADYRFKTGEPVPHRADWKFDGPLGIGGFGEVWRISQTHFDRVEAIKFCLNDRAQRVLANEGETLAALQRQLPAHPNIVPATAINLSVEPYWLAFEFVPGQRLDTVIAERGPLPWRDALEIFAGLCRGMAAAHHAGIVHRDLKPGNILLDTAGVPRILDFGLGKLLAEDVVASEAGDVAGSLEASGALSVPGKTIAGFGTPMFMSPEQRQRQPATPADDVYALGVVLFQMLVGDPTREPNYVRETLAEAKSAAPPDLIDLCADCFAHPSKRPHDAGELLARVEKLLGGKIASRDADKLAKADAKAKAKAEKQAMREAKQKSKPAKSGKPDTHEDAPAVATTLMMSAFMAVGLTMLGTVLNWMFGASATGDVARVIGAFAGIFAGMGIFRILTAPFGGDADLSGLGALIGFALGTIFGPDLAMLAGAQTVFQVALLGAAATSFNGINMVRRSRNIVKAAVTAGIIFAMVVWWIQHTNGQLSPAPAPPSTVEQVATTEGEPTRNVPATTEPATDPASNEPSNAGPHGHQHKRDAVPGSARTVTVTDGAGVARNFFLFDYQPFSLTMRAWGEVRMPWSLLVCAITGAFEIFLMIVLFLPSAGYYYFGVPGAVVGAVVTLAIFGRRGDD